MNLICFTHSTYAGVENPVLSCKTCCQIFLAVLKENPGARAQTKTEHSDWMLEKVGEARKALQKKAPQKSAVQPK